MNGSSRFAESSPGGNNRPDEGCDEKRKPPAKIVTAKECHPVGGLNRNPFASNRANISVEPNRTQRSEPTTREKE
ncbi:hypothetical protein ZHAS_00010999 [Anopheles sinensis]|uniref:Uncharacterized protein n=1 Tax=Anopheles sinensis TaxID=74873 RepID=A0A084VZ29_ANOSI|nr:hypothetical protein ZHAS_00010999 [Anopheles sinensis]